MKSLDTNGLNIVYIQCGALILRIVEEGKFSTGELPIQVLFSLHANKGVILWSNQGLHRLIPASIVHNAYCAYCIARELEKGFGTYHQIEAPASLKEISWDQGIEVTPELARHLMSATQDTDESVESESSPDTATDKQPG